MNLTHDFAVLIARYLIALTVLISSLELLAARSLFAAEGLLGWPLLVTTHRRRRQPIEGVRNTLLCAGGLSFLHALGGLIAVILFIPSLPRHLTGCLYLALLALHLLHSYRSTFGGDGSDQMSNIVLAGLAFDAFATGTGPLRDAGLWFIAIQCAMSYCVAGIAKAVSPIWRSGRAPREILRSSTYGSATGLAIMESLPAGSRLVAWATILVECLFPLALFAPLPVVLFFLGMGLLFHLSNSAFMGLNSFLTAFAAAYPAIVLLNPHLHYARTP